MKKDPLDEEFHMPDDEQATAEESHTVNEKATDMEKEFPKSAEIDVLYDEYADIAPAKEEGKKDKHWMIKRRMLIPIASVIAGASLIFSSFNYDPLGKDFLNADTSLTTCAASSSVNDQNSITTVVIHVTYLPTGETYTPDSTDEKALADARAWVVSKGGNADTMRCIQSETVLTGIEYSDDFIFIGDSDNLPDGYIAQGTAIYTYRCDIYYEAYALDDMTTTSEP